MTEICVHVYCRQCQTVWFRQIYSYYDSEFRTEGALTLKAFADNASAIRGTESNKYERYYGPGRRQFAYLLQYMPTVSPACHLCINIHHYASPPIVLHARAAVY